MSPPAAQLHERIGFLGAGAEDATGAMVLEAAPDEMDAVRKQRRSERVAGVANVASTVEGEMERPPPINPAPTVQTVLLRGAIADVHGGSSVPEPTTVRSRLAPLRAGAAGVSISGRGSPIA